MITIKHNTLKIMGLPLLLMLITACATKATPYSANDFITPNRIVTEKIPTVLPTPHLSATFGVGNDPRVIKAYQEFTKKGIAKTINADGFKTFAYDAYAHPLIVCAPLHLCVVQLEQGEKINDINLGDSVHWLTTLSRVGPVTNGSYQIVVKPKLVDMATDMVITTSKRAYNIGLVSQQGATTHVVNFYYPQETLEQALQQTQQRADSPLLQQIVDQQPQIAINHINFNYRLQGDSPTWKPVRVFDDGNKTFIQMPALSEQVDLPVLYILRNRTMELVNYRYRKPYYIIDGLFAKAYLISGNNTHQDRVEMINKNFG